MYPIIALLTAMAFAIVTLLVSPHLQRKLHAFILTNRRGSADTVGTLFYIGIFIVAGVLLFVKVFVKLDEERDADFSAAANATIAGVEGDFFSGVDLLRISLIIIPVAVIMGYLLLVRMRS